MSAEVAAEEGGGGGKRGVSVAREVITPSRHAEPQPTHGEMQQAVLNVGKIIAKHIGRSVLHPGKKISAQDFLLHY